MNRTYVGVDPGLTGGISALIPGSPMPAVFDMPIVPVKGDKTKNELSVERLRGIFRKLRDDCGAMLVMVEQPQMRSGVRPAQPLVNGRPHLCGFCKRPHMEVNQGVASQGNFREQGGIIKGVLAGMDIPYEFVPAQTWSMAIFGGRKAAGAEGKEQSRLKAIKLYPTMAERLKLKKSHGLSEALLIAHFAKQRYNNNDNPF